MPNHVTLIALCAGTSNFYEHFDLKEEFHSKIDFCEIVCPCPPELQEIHSGGVTIDGLEYSNWRVKNGVNISIPAEEFIEIESKYGFTNWYDWCKHHWGTKWGIYNVIAHELGGDCSPILIEMQCAWSPPNDECHELIDKYLKEKYGFTQIAWSLVNPFDNSILARDFEGEE